MDDFLQRLKQRKLVQWAVAYLAAAWVLLQVLDLATGSYHWPDAVMHIAFGVLAVGFVVVLVLAWYHGERGAQRVSGVELLIVALVLVVGGGVLWNFSRTSGQTGATNEVAATPTTSAVGAHAPGAAANTPIRVPAAATSAMTLAASSIAAQPIPAKSVAVLPFENLSTDKSNAYFADGMQDLILTKIADIGDLKVISRTSTEQYGSRPGNLTKIGEQLGVATILEGSVQKAGNQVLINVQLIDAKTDSHIWAQDYTRTLDNIFGVEGEVADKVAVALKAKLTEAESTRVTSVPTQNPAAFDAYLRGEHYLSMVKAGNFKMLPDTVEAYRRATQADPKFALAWARMAFVQSMLMYTSTDVSKATGQQALANAKQALALEPNLPYAHLALGYVYRFDLQDLDKALAEFRVAQQGLPNNAEVEAAIAYLEDGRGDVRVAVARLERAVMLDPRGPNLAVSLGDVNMELRQYDRARIAYQRVLALAPDDPEGYSALARVELLQHGDVNAALAELDKAPAALQSDPEIVYERARLLVLKRDYTTARKVLATLHPGGRFVTPPRVALLRGWVNVLSGNADAARKDYQHALTLARTAHAQISIIYAEIGLGNKQAAFAAAQDVRASAQRGGMTWALNALRYALACAYTNLGDAGHAVSELDALLRSPTSGSFSVPLLELDPTWDPIRHDPGFQALLKNYGKAGQAPSANSAGAAPNP